MTKPAVKHSDVLKVKCDALPYRTVFYRANCYFVIDAAADSTASRKQCSTVFPGAKIVADAPEDVFARLFAQKSDFIQDGGAIKGKKAMCFYENAFPCAPDAPVTSTGTCSRLRKEIPASTDQNDSTKGAYVQEPQKITVQMAYNYMEKFAKPMQINQTIHFKGVFSHYAGACQINLGGAGGDTTYLLRVIFNFANPGEKSLSLAAKVNNKWVGTVYKTNPFKYKQPYDIAIQALEDRFQIYFSGKPMYQFTYKLPLTALTGVSIGEVQYVNYARLGERLDPHPLVIGAENGFPMCRHTCAKEICKSLYITGIAAQWHDSLAFVFFANKRGDGDLTFTFDYRWKQGEVTVMNNRINGKMGKEEIVRSKVFKGGQPFEIRIVKEISGFQIFVNGTHFAHFAHRSCPVKDDLDIDIRGIGEPVITVK